MADAIRLMLTTIAAILGARGEHQLAEYINLAESLIREGDDAAEELEELANQIQTMVREDRGPTPEELGAVRTRRQELRDILDDARESADTPDSG